MIQTIEGLIADMIGTSATIDDRADDVAEVHARQLAARQRAAAPVGETGRTRATISARRLPGDGVAWTAGTETPYARYVEFGTSRQPPQPFIGPAGDAAADGYADAIGDAALF